MVFPLCPGLGARLGRGWITDWSLWVGPCCLALVAPNRDIATRVFATNSVPEIVPNESGGIEKSAFFCFGDGSLEIGFCYLVTKDFVVCVC